MTTTLLVSCLLSLYNIDELNQRILLLCDTEKTSMYEERSIHYVRVANTKKTLHAVPELAAQAISQCVKERFSDLFYDEPTHSNFNRDQLYAVLGCKHHKDCL